MDSFTPNMAHHLEKLHENVSHFLSMTNEEIFQLDYSDVKELQLKFLRLRFEQLRPRVKALNRLSKDLNIEQIDTLDDAAALSFPHTMYKSYSIKDLENQAFDRMTRWLGTLTSVDLSQVDTNGCDSIESWLKRIETATPLRISTSSGTSGKISLWPRTQIEEDQIITEAFLRMYDPYQGEKTIDLRSGEDPVLCLLKYDKGRHNMTVIIRALRKNVYNGREEMVVTAGRGLVTADDMWLSSKLRRAESRGEQLNLTPSQIELAKDIAKRIQTGADSMGTFIEDAVIKMRGRRVLFLGGWVGCIQLAQACRERGVKVEWAPDSVLVGGGGAKGSTFPDGWRELIDEVLPFTVKESYWMTECSAIANKCSEGHLHPMPWGIPTIVNPESGEPLGRTGVVTGRMSYFDLLPESMWAGTITGDEVTVHWDGGCACGRNGPFYDNDVHRFTETRAGDDKISCAKTPEAYDRLLDYATTLID